MDLVADNLRDFQQYCRNGYVGRPKKQGGFDVFLVTERSHGEDAVLQPTNPDKGRIDIHWKEVLDKFVFVPPYSGCISVKGTVIHVHRSPVKTYRKTFSKELYSFKIPNLSLLKKGGLYPDTEVKTRDIAEGVYNPVYYTYSSLFDKLQKGELIGGAISKNLGLYIDGGYEDTLVLYKDKLIGKAKITKAVLPKPWEIYAERIGKELKTNVEIQE